jgi:hypothetical protein
MGLMTALFSLDLSTNQLSGTIPSSLCSNGADLLIDCAEITCQTNCCLNLNYDTCGNER